MSASRLITSDMVSSFSENCAVTGEPCGEYIHLELCGQLKVFIWRTNFGACFFCFARLYNGLWKYFRVQRDTTSVSLFLKNNEPGEHFVV